MLLLLAAGRPAAKKRQWQHDRPTRWLRATRPKVREGIARAGDSGVIKGGGGSDMVQLTNLAGPQTSGACRAHKERRGA